VSLASPDLYSYEVSPAAELHRAKAKRVAGECFTNLRKYVISRYIEI